MCYQHAAYVAQPVRQISEALQLCRPVARAAACCVSVAMQRHGREQRNDGPGAHLANENSATGRLRFCIRALESDATGVAVHLRGIRRRHDPAPATSCLDAVHGASTSCTELALPQERRQPVLTPLMLALLSLWNLQTVHASETALHTARRAVVSSIASLLNAESYRQCRPLCFVSALSRAPE